MIAMSKSLLLIGLSTGAITILGFSALMINWKGTTIAEANTPQLLPSVVANKSETLPLDTTALPVLKAPKPTEFVPTTFIPEYQPKLPTDVQHGSEAWNCWHNGGGRDCLARNWEYEPPPPELTEWEKLEQERRQNRWNWLPFKK